MDKLNDWAETLQECVELAIPTSGSGSANTGTTCSGFSASCPTSIFNATDPNAIYFNTSISASNTTSNSPYSFQVLNSDVDQSCGNLEFSENIAATACHDAGVVQCVLGLSQAYQDWYSWVSLSCKGVSASNSTSAGSSTPVGPSTMVMNASSRIAVRAVNFVVPLLLSILYSISGG
jgi:hypothetical protein